MGPVASFTMEPSPARANEEVLFDASSSTGDIVLYAWDFGDGTTATGVRVTHIYTAEGTYTVRLTVTDGKGRQAQAEQVLTVLPEENPPLPGGPRASFTAEPWQGEAPLTVTFDASASTGDIVSYLWDFGDGGTGFGVVTEHTYTEPGAYTARLTVRDREGREHSASRRIFVYAAAEPPAPGEGPTAAFTADPEMGEIPLTVRFDASASTGDIVSYAWDFGDGSTGSGVTTQHTYTAWGQYVVRLTVRDRQGRMATAERTVTALPPPPPPPG